MLDVAILEEGPSEDKMLNGGQYRCDRKEMPTHGLVNGIARFITNTGGKYPWDLRLRQQE